jgi:hypothetical protein
MWRSCWQNGVVVTYETIGQWVRRFGPVFAQELRRCGRRPGDKRNLRSIAVLVNRKALHGAAEPNEGGIYYDLGHGPGVGTKAGQ